MSLFQNLSSLKFKPKEINDWRKALTVHSDEGKAIEKNCRLETRVADDDMRKAFLARILSNWQKFRDPIKAIQMAVSLANNSSSPDELLLNGPAVGIDLPNTFEFLARYDAVDRFAAHDGYQLLNEKEIEAGEVIKTEQLPDKPTSADFSGQQIPIV